MDIDETFTDFEYLGEETIDGVRAKHFTGLNRGEPETFTVRTDYWIGLNGLPVQQKVERVQDVGIEGYPETRLVAITKATGYGEENIITAPIQATPVPTPVATSVPTPEPTPTPTPGSTPEPTLESTPVPTAEPTSSTLV